MQIKFKGNIETSSTVDRFKNEDVNLLGTQTLINNFDPNINYIEHVIYDASEQFLLIDYNYLNYKLPSKGYNLNNNTSYNNLEINPILDLQEYYNVGEFISQYNFFKTWVSNPNDLDLFIKEISPDRTELKLSTTSTLDIKELTNKLIIDKNSNFYLKPFLLNFGDNNLKLFINIDLDGDYIIIKLYEPLSNDLDVNSKLCIVEEISLSTKFYLNVQSEIIPEPSPFLKGPNFDIELDIKNTIPTKYESKNTLLSNYTGSSLQAILNQINLAEVEINVDYTDNVNFVRFSSAEKRLINFYNKVKQIEDYNSFITNYSSSNQSNIRLQLGQYSSSINDIVTKFDSFENYLYFNSSSYTWPKSNTISPYILESTGSSNVLTWYSSSIDTAIYYDNNNPDKLSNLIPEYITVDENNTPYIQFIDMIGHYFDNVWIYIKSITDYYKSYNNDNEGISKDLVFFALQDLGVKLYNTKEDNDLYDYILGNNNDSSQKLIAELYKRIYHNIPLLFKGKGSYKTIQELVSTFGVTSSILNVKEYGGNSNTEAALLDYSSNKVRIVDNTIYSASYGTILHPHIKLADNTYENYKNDDSRIDVSFSPQNQLDLVISASIVNSNPNFNIDEYIGNPQYELSSSYTGLDIIRNNVISSSFPTYYDFRGFIELTQYFDNTLFKMIKDYIPAKSNLSEGIVIRQQALERIKWKRNLPNIEKQTQYEANYSTASLGSQYDNLFTYLEGNKKAYYNGEISGSNKDIYTQYFIPNNTNKWALSSSLNDSLFLKSDYNVTLNNISSSIISKRKKLEKKPYSSQSLLTTLELQDDHDKSWNDIRYNGVKLSSAQYNIYTPGDNTIDKLPVISNLDSCIYELEWGGGGYPENTTGGGLSLGNILVVGETKDDILKLEPNDPVYKNILEKNIPLNLSKIVHKPYSPGGNLPTEMLIAYPNVGLPNASYYLGSGGPPNYTSPGAIFGYFYHTNGASNKPSLILSGTLSSGIPKSKINSNGHLETDYNDGKLLYETIYEISSSLQSGSKWFISLYSGSGDYNSPVSGLPRSASGVNLNQYGHPFEIEMAYTGSVGGHVFSYLICKTGSGIFNVSSYFSGSSNPLAVGLSQSKASTGFLLTQASYPTNGITIFNYGSGNFSGTGKGYLFLPHKKDIITNNIDYIIQNYSINPT